MATVIPSGKYLSVASYAKQCGISKAGVYAAIKSHRLQAYNIDGVIIIPVNAIISSRRERTGMLIGISELKNGNVEAFLRKRGIKNAD